MATLLGLLAALTYGAGDFAAGLAGRRIPSSAVAALVLVLETATAAVAVLVEPGDGPSVHALAWGALSGLGGGAGTLALYRGLAGGRMTVVAPISGVLAAVLPAIVGVALGDRLGAGQAAGIVLAVPAIALVSRPRATRAELSRTPSGTLDGLMAGCGFALLFVALDRAGTRSGAWPVLPGQICALLLVAPFALRNLRATSGSTRPGAAASGAGRRGIVRLIAAAGVLSAAANLLYLAATGRGQLAIVAVLTSLYPGATVLLARALLHERWSGGQLAGLVGAAASIVLVTVRL